MRVSTVMEKHLKFFLSYKGRYNNHSSNCHQDLIPISENVSEKYVIHTQLELLVLKKSRRSDLSVLLIFSLSFLLKKYQYLKIKSLQLVPTCYTSKFFFLHQSKILQ